ncbi:MAG: hypothetical protein NTW87_02385 [Planctomycetota bacterium]|nr:hypothetical protein [Planctomycetota bacterium]
MQCVIAIYLAVALFSVVWSGTALAAPAELKTDAFCLRFAADGRPAAFDLLPANDAVLDTRNPGPGFFLAKEHQRTPLTNVSIKADGRLVVSSADGAQAVTFAVHASTKHVALRIESLTGIAAEPGISLHFEMNANTRVRVTELDHMTRVQNEPRGVRVHWDHLWHRTAGEPLGGFAILAKKDDADEDETLLRIWVEEKLPHPKVDGEWTFERARQWVADWQRLFADRSQMIIEGESIEELRAAIPFAEKAQIKEIYLFTQTWRTDNFWPGNHGNVHINRKIFPNGEDDLRAFSEFVKSKGMRLNLHYVSGGIGPGDPTYVGSKPDPRLASWGRGQTARAVSAKDKDIPFTPATGVTWPPSFADQCFETNFVRIGDEIVRVGAFEQTNTATWLLKNCARGQFKTKAADQAQDTEVVALVSAYGQNFVPDNDSALLDEVAAGFANLINRCGIGHTEYDGAEIHCYNGRWGYQKFATKVYEKLDHPVTAHDSSGTAPRCHFEYRLNGTRAIFRGTCPFTHGNWSAPVELASPSRVASTVLDANFVLSQGHLGGAMGLCKPEPMFAVSDKTLKAHGLTGRLLETLLNWKAVSRLLSDEQRAKIDASFGRPTSRLPERNHHVVSSVVQTVRKTADGYQIVPVCVMTRKSGDIKWQQGQEHGALSPRQYVKPGEELSLENPFAAQPAKFIIRVLWAFDPQGKSVSPGTKVAATETSVKIADQFTAGNTGATTGGTSAEPNVLLQPAAKDLRDPGALTVAQEGQALRLTKENTGDRESWELEKLPSWGRRLDMRTHRGIGMTITGDGSGAILVVQIPGRDYTVPIAFTGKRYVEIPNGEVAWTSGHWGWRMATKNANYSGVSWMKIGVGCVPPKTKASVLVEELSALAEIPVTLVNPVVHTGPGTLTVKGSVASGQYLQYEGGDTAAVCDENWNRLKDLPVEKTNYTMPAGWAPVSIATTQAAPLPWLEVQFMTEGEPMTVPAR